MSLHNFLTRLILLCIAPLVLLAVYLTVNQVHTLRAERDANAAQRARNSAASIDQYLNARIGALQVLAASPMAGEASHRHELYQQAHGFVQSFGSHVSLVDHQQRRLFTTQAPFPAGTSALPPAEGGALAAQALATDTPVIGNVQPGRRADEASVMIAVPGQRENAPGFVLIATADTRQFQQRIEQLAFPAGWSLTLLDGEGKAIARRPAGSERLRDVAASGRFVADSTISAWSVLVEIPRASYFEPLIETAVALIIALVGATLAGIVGGLRASRRLATSVASLTETPAADAPPPSITEIAAARRLLDESADQRRAAEAALMRSAERLRLALEATSDGVWDWDLASGTVYRSLRFYELIGRPADEQSSDLDFFKSVAHPDDLPRVWQAIRAHRRGASPAIDVAFRLAGAANGARWINVRGRCVERDGQGRPLRMVGTLTDISERKKVEEEIRTLNATLEQRVEERTAELRAINEELDSFAYAVSHDLRAPLRAMNGFSQALIEDYGDLLSGEAALYLQQIDVASRRMGQLVDGLLALSRSTRGGLQRERIDVSALARRVADALARAGVGERGAAPRIEIEPGLFVDGDPRMIEAVLFNLLGNALKYSAKIADPLIRVHWGEVGGVTGVCVADNGAGFDMAYAGQLFQPFRRLHRQDEFPGIGIGLATVWRIIHRHGGEITAHSAPDRGATFCFRLPPAAPADAPGAERP